MHALNLAGVQNRDRKRLVESKRGDSVLSQDHFKIMNKFNHFGHMCALRNSNQCDLSFTMVANEKYFLINDCKKIKSSLVWSTQLDGKTYKLIKLPEGFDGFVLNHKIEFLSFRNQI